MLVSEELFFSSIFFHIENIIKTPYLKNLTVNTTTPQKD